MVTHEGPDDFSLSTIAKREKSKSIGISKQWKEHEGDGL